MGTAIRARFKRRKGQMGFSKTSTLSEEEELDGGTMWRKRPNWRSEELNAFLDTLDKRADQASRTARKERILGSPLDSRFPDELPTWMLRVDSVSTQ